MLIFVSDVDQIYLYKVKQPIWKKNEEIDKSIEKKE
jgi:hypothetical protein